MKFNKVIVFTASSFALLLTLVFIVGAGVSGWAIACQPYGLELPMIGDVPMLEAGQQYCDQLPG